MLSCERFFGNWFRNELENSLTRESIVEMAFKPIRILLNRVHFKRELSSISEGFKLQSERNKDIPHDWKWPMVGWVISETKGDAAQLDHAGRGSKVDVQPQRACSFTKPFW